MVKIIVSPTNLDIIKVLSFELDRLLNQQSDEIIPHVHVVLVNDVLVGENMTRPERQDLPAVVVRVVPAHRPVERISNRRRRDKRVRWADDVDCRAERINKFNVVLLIHHTRAAVLLDDL